jgi:molecular chaperone GrpE
VKLIKAEVIEDFLPLADSFEMAMSDQEAWEAVPENWRKGVEYIYNQLESILAAHGVIVIDPLGLIFDPQDHESVGIIETDQAGEDNFILEVKKKGYKLGQRLIRPAQVKIGEYNKKGKKIINFLI